MIAAVPDVKSHGSMARRRNANVKNDDTAACRGGRARQVDAELLRRGLESQLGVLHDLVDQFARHPTSIPRLV